MAGFSNKYVSAIKKVKGHGSAHDGLHHWIAHRFTLLLLIPLALWFCFAMLGVLADNTIIVEWLGEFHNGILTVAFLLVAIWHAKLSSQVMIEDYIACRFLRKLVLIGLNALAWLMILTVVYTVVNVSFGYGV